MIKNKYLFFLVVFILFQCSKPEKIEFKNSIIDREITKQTDCEKFGLKGNVRQWIRQSFRFSEENSGHREKILLNKEVYVFNESCMKIEAQGFNENNEMTFKDFISYNDEGNIIEENYYDSKGILLVKVRYHYNDTGIIIEEVKEDVTGHVIYTSLWNYDKNGNNSEYTKSMKGNDQNRIVTVVKRTFNNKGNIKSENRIEYRIDGSIHFRKNIHYDRNGKIVKSLEYDGEDKLTNRTDYNYTKEGKLLTFIEYFYNYETDAYVKQITSYIYDKKGNLLESKEPGQTVVYKYDGNGNKTEVMEYSEHDKLLNKLLISYDDKNKKRKEVRMDYTENEGEGAEYVYSYDENEKIVLWAKYDHTGNLLYEYPVFYDENGNKREEVVESTTLKNDNWNSTMLSTVHFPKIKYRYKFDDWGNHIETLCSRLNGQDKPELAMAYEYIITYRE